MLASSTPRPCHPRKLLSKMGAHHRICAQGFGNFWIVPLRPQRAFLGRALPFRVSSSSRFRSSASSFRSIALLAILASVASNRDKSESSIPSTRALLRSGDYTKTQVAAELGVERHTFWRASARPPSLSVLYIPFSGGDPNRTSCAACMTPATIPSAIWRRSFQSPGQPALMCEIPVIVIQPEQGCIAVRWQRSRRSISRLIPIYYVDRFHNWPRLIGLTVIVRIVFEIHREPNIPATASSIIVAPTILPRDADGAKLAAGASCNACAGG